MRTDKWIARWMASGLACLALLLPTNKAAAQGGILKEIFGWLFETPSWNVDVHGGVGGYGRFLLQTPTRDLDDFRQREVTASSAWSLGAGIGATILPQMGFRITFNHTWANLDFRDDTGIDSELLDLDEIADITQNVIELELIRYLLLEKVRISPYVSAGVLASWWSLDRDETIAIVSPDGTHFRWGGLLNVGLQYRASEKIRIRLESATASIGNPFTGRNSFIVVNGRTIDEPSTVRKTDIRLGVAYTFGQPKKPGK